MGVIISGVRMISEPYNYILQKAKDVRVSKLAAELETFINNSFAGLRPLSHKYKVVCNMSEEHTNYLCVGTWLRTKWGRNSRGYGSHVGNIVPYILKYGDELSEHVRRPIKDDFADIVDLTKELKKYEDISEVIGIEPKKLYKYNMSWHDDCVEVHEKEVKELSLNTSSPKTVVMMTENDEDPWKVDITYERSPAVIEDVIDNVVRLYNMVDAKLSVVRDHNQQIMSQIDQIVTPHMLLKALK